VKELGFRRLATVHVGRHERPSPAARRLFAECRQALAGKLEILISDRRKSKSRPLLLEPGPKGRRYSSPCAEAMAWRIFRLAQAANLSIRGRALPCLASRRLPPSTKWLPCASSRPLLRSARIAVFDYTTPSGDSPQGGSPRKILTPIYFKDGDSVASPVGRLVEERSSR
jgi:hypothetical protein